MSNCLSLWREAMAYFQDGRPHKRARVGDGSTRDWLSLTLCDPPEGGGQSGILSASDSNTTASLPWLATVCAQQETTLEEHESAMLSDGETVVAFGAVSLTQAYPPSNLLNSPACKHSIHHRHMHRHCGCPEPRGHSKFRYLLLRCQWVNHCWESHTFNIQSDD